MNKDTNFWLDQPGVSEVILRKNKKLDELEEAHMEKVLADVKAKFLLDFGTEGEFELSYRPTKYRSAYRISAANAKTATILKANSGWLAQFSGERL